MLFGILQDEENRNDMIKTKSVYDPVEDSDGFRIVVMRKWPQGVGYRKNNKRGMNNAKIVDEFKLLIRIRRKFL